MRRAAVIAALVSLAVSTSVLGCGGSAHEPGGFLAEASDGAIFIQWTRSGDSVTGSLTIAHRKASDDGYESVERENVAFSGVISGSSVTLTLDQAFGFNTNWNGTLDGEELTLTFAGEDGSLTTLHFRPADVSDYNEAVADLRNAVGTANDELAQAAFQAEAAEAIDEASVAVVQDLTNLNEHVRAAEDALASLPPLLSAEEAAVSKTYAALQTTLASGPDDVCYEAGGVEYEAGGVEYEKGGVDGALDQVNGYLSAIDDDLARLSADFDALQATLATLPGYEPQGLPTEGEVADARAAADASIAAIVKTGRSHRKRAQAMRQTAQGYVAQARRACGE